MLYQIPIWQFSLIVAAGVVGGMLLLGMIWILVSVVKSKKRKKKKEMKMEKSILKKIRKYDGDINR